MSRRQMRAENRSPRKAASPPYDFLHDFRNNKACSRKSTTSTLCREPASRIELSSTRSKMLVRHAATWQKSSDVDGLFSAMVLECISKLDVKNCEEQLHLGPLVLILVLTVSKHQGQAPVSNSAAILLPRLIARQNQTQSTNAMEDFPCRRSTFNPLTRMYNSGIGMHGSVECGRWKVVSTPS